MDVARVARVARFANDLTEDLREAKEELVALKSEAQPDWELLFDPCRAGSLTKDARLPWKAREAPSDPPAWMHRGGLFLLVPHLLTCGTCSYLCRLFLLIDVTAITNMILVIK